MRQQKALSILFDRDDAKNTRSIVFTGRNMPKTILFTSSLKSIIERQ